MPVNVWDIESDEVLSKLRALAEMAAGSGSAIPDTGRLIGPCEVPPLVVEVRLGADITGEIVWLYRADITDGAWRDHGYLGTRSFADVKEQLARVLPEHVCVWYEREGEFSWSDC
jgi:hypothetical protein